eukprot:164217_1
MTQPRVRKERIHDPNCCCLRNIPYEDANETTLTSWLSDFGWMRIISIKKQHFSSEGTYAAWILFDDANSASEAVTHFNNPDLKYYGYKFKADFAKTKYCETFIQNEYCNKEDCPFLHSWYTERRQPHHVFEYY